MLPACLKDSRCIVHVDLDSFYCQVEQVRLGLSPDIPVAVQQWQGLIAVNYPARRAGVTRHSNVEEAKNHCPELTLVHVATYAGDDPEPRYYPNPDRSTHKVSLDPYRRASKEIFKIFSKYCSTIQKVGLDEGYMDFTSVVNERLVARYRTQLVQEEGRCDVPIDWDALGITVKAKREEEEGAWDPPTWRDVQLAIGAEIASEIRKEIYDKLHYTCSAGISHNMVLAKLCSSLNKPNKQTILRDSVRLEFMATVPFTKIRNLGGKLGNEIESELNIVNSSDLWKYSAEELQKKFGMSTGLWIYNIARGIDHEEVNVTKAPKSLMASKSFRPPVRTAQEMRQWFNILSAELHQRIMTNLEDFGTWPKTLSINFRATHDTSYRHKSCSMPGRKSLRSHEVLVQKVVDIFGTIEDAYPCVGLSLQAGGLAQDSSRSNHDIKSLFAAAHQKQKKQQTTIRPAAAAVTKEVVEGKEKELCWTCDKCHESVSVSKIDEHTDFHFASELQQAEERRLKRKEPDGPPQPPPAKTKKLFFS